MFTTNALPRQPRPGIDECMTEPVQAAILAVIERAPMWIKQDLTSKDPGARVRAEESLAMIIADAISKQSEQPE
ncbi:hypothetical protein BRX37_25575 [Sphingomonas sp. S-NIH.Pt3_0716]|jgi:hypothetical protein|uniref:Uncharacterized protein n=2 Tax=Sphingomonadaceae TaxID=41297 RepID=A0A430BAU4_SPHYA|nr:hypothetical protein DAH51_27325 [Sphingobium yanoikuyae]RSU66888.1 hypothetical protein BRX37_25575 [Sphingomonas sp. S-NIH.Pt3_0716]